MTYDVTVGERAAKLAVEKDAFVYTREGGAALSKPFSAVPTGPGTYSVLIEGRSYRATVGANGEIAVNGRTLRVGVRDPRKLRGRGSAESGGGRRTVAAPMPGRVIRILVEIGQDVEAAQALIVVEAMKMQNEMKSPKAGRVLEIRTAAGAAVAAGDALVVIE